MKSYKKQVPGGIIHIFESKTGQLTSNFVQARNIKHKSQADLILELLKDNGGMTPDSISKTLNISLIRARELCSKLKARGLVKKIGICYELE